MEGGDEGGGVDVVGGAAAGEVVEGFGEALEEGAVGGGAAEAFDEFVADVAAVEVGEDEGVGVSGDGRAGGFAGGDGGDEGSVGLEFAVDAELGGAFGDDAEGFLDFGNGGVRGTAFGGEREKGEGGLFLHDGADAGGGGDGDFGELDGVGVDVDGAVGKGVDAFGGAEEHDAGDGTDAGGGADAVEGGADGVGGGVSGAADEAVGVTGGDHEGGVEEGGADDGAGFEFGDAFGAAAFVVEAPVAVVLGAADEDGFDEFFAAEAIGGGEDAGVGAFGEDDAAAGPEGADLFDLLSEEALGGDGKRHRCFFIVRLWNGGGFVCVLGLCGYLCWRWD